MPALYSGHQRLLFAQVWTDGYENARVDGALPHLKSTLIELHGVAKLFCLKCHCLGGNPVLGDLNVLHCLPSAICRQLFRW